MSDGWRKLSHRGRALSSICCAAAGIDHGQALEMRREEPGSRERLIRFSAVRPPSSVGRTVARRWDEPLAHPMFFRCEVGNVKPEQLLALWQSIGL